MKPRLHHLGLTGVFLGAALLAPLAADAKQAPGDRTPDDFSLPFESWLKAGELVQIPWEVHISPAYLRTEQRQAVDFTVRVQAADLNSTGPTHDLYWLVRLHDAQGVWLNTEEPTRLAIHRPLAAVSEVEFRGTAFILPGKYRAAVLFYDHATHKRNLRVYDLEVNRLRPDPLPDSFRNLPPVEFLAATSGWDAYYQPTLKGKLWLPLETRRPVEVEILVNFSPTPQFNGKLYPAYLNIRRMLAALKPLSEIRPTNGRLRVTGFDLSARKILFEQQNLTELDWPRLRDAVAALNPRVVSVEELSGTMQRAAFFRELLAERLRRPADRRVPAGYGVSLHRVFIVLSSHILFPQGTDLQRIKAQEKCDCRVYYLRLPLLKATWDELGGIMKPLKPRRFDIESPHNLRKALARILKELGQL